MNFRRKTHLSGGIGYSSSWISVFIILRNAFNIFETLFSAVHTLEEFTDEQLTSQKHHETTDEGISHDFKDKSDEAAISNNLELPCVPDHEVEVGVLVDGGGDAAVVIQELVRGDLTVTHCVRSLELEVYF